MKKLCLHPLFLLGLAIRIFLIISLAPLAITEWFAPFLQVTTTQFSIDPWLDWTTVGGTPLAFPYGYAMWLVFLPLAMVAKLTALPFSAAYTLTLLAADFALLSVLRHLLPGRNRLLLVTYWLSPIMIIATYGLGYNDVIPVFFLTVSICFTRKLQFRYAGAACSAAISAKLSMVLVLPFFFLYLYNNRALRQRLPQFLKGLLLGGLVFGVPFLFSTSGVHMLFNNREMGKVYLLGLGLGKSLVIYVVPLIYLVMLYMVWRIRRLNFDLFYAMLGMVFLLVVLMTPASPGWFVWVMPSLVTYQAFSGPIALVLTAIFSGFYVLSSLLTTPLILANGNQFELGAIFHFSTQFGSHTESLLHTTMVALGIILALRIWRETVNYNDFFRLSRKPFVIGIAGDSGSGKDTFSHALQGLFGKHSVTTLSGDDYHLWDRQKPMWQVMTHLNPMANDLESFANDLVALSDGRSIQSRHYDHQTGKMGKPLRVKSNDYIIASGLHTLFLPILRNCYNLGVYLDIDERLRRHFKLRRDVHQRGHVIEQVLKSFETREPDSAKFIRPQSAYADLVLSLQPVDPRVLAKPDENRLLLKLVARSRQSFNELSIQRVLVGVCGLHVDMEVNDDGSEVSLTIEGETTAEDISLAAQKLCPRITEFLDIFPKWQGGVLGLMQLVTLAHINQALTKRYFT